MKRLVIVQLALLQGGNTQRNTELLEKMAALAKSLKLYVEDLFALENKKDISVKKVDASFQEVLILCSESPKAHSTVEIFQKAFGVLPGPHQELCSTDGHKVNLKNLNDLVDAQRSSIVILITDEYYRKTYPAYFSVMRKYRKPFGETNLEVGQAFVINNDKTSPSYGSSEIVNGVVATTQVPQAVEA